MYPLPTLLLALLTLTNSNSALTRWGAPFPPAELKMQQLAEPLVARVARQRSFVVDTYVHIIVNSTQSGTTMYPPSMVEEQVGVMNDECKSSRFSFKMRNLTYTTNEVWSSCLHGACELDYKTKLRQRSYEDLNLYFFSNLGSISGFYYFPVSAPTAEQRLYDGCTNRAGIMPGGETTNYHLGFTAVHEVGHSLGLFHTFQGNSCDRPGDFVPDTPHQLNATHRCPTKSDTCPGQPGDDPIHNFMNHSFDTCTTEFTRFQSARALVMYVTMRFGR